MFGESMIEKKIKVLDGVKVFIEKGKKVKIEGTKGVNEREFKFKWINIRQENGFLIIKSDLKEKKAIAIINTIAKHLVNLMKGVKEGFNYKMKIIYSHFPINVNVKEKEKIVLINNFLGEKKARESKIIGETKVKVSGNMIEISGINKEHVGQTAANLENTTKPKSKDRRKFIDGIYIVEKDKK